MRNFVVAKLHDLELALCQQYPRTSYLVHKLKFSRLVMGGKFETLGAFYSREE